MTTANKLQGILDSKEAIRLAINNKGVTVDENVTFSEYAGKISDIPSGGEPNFLRIKMTQIIDGNTCEIQLETEETPNGFLGYIENEETQEINLIQEI